MRIRRLSRQGACVAEVNRIGLRKLWFQIHKWIGLLLAILIIPLSLSGSALVWHDWLDEAVNPQRYAVNSHAPLLAPSAYVASAAKALEPGNRISTLRYPEHGGPIVVNAVKPGKGPPARTNMWIDPATGRVLDVAGGNEGLVRVLHGLHGSFLIPGVGRQIVGWLGVAMLISALSGLWLWWPAMGRWTRGLCWKRARDFDANLHHQMGFWIAIPLAMLSFTGMWISFPLFFAAITGGGDQQRAGNERAQRMRAVPIEAPRLGADAVLEIAGAGKPISIGWPTDMAPAWKVSLEKAGEVRVDDATGERKASPRGEGGGSQGTARLMRRLHDGTGMGPLWQIAIFIGGILPAALAVTGIIMWARARRWRGDLARRREERSIPV
jgi:uncharacterized iron-regulated membrane protein